MRIVRDERLIKYSRLVAVWLLCAMVAACTTTGNNAPYLTPPNLLERLANADLSPRYPQKNPSDPNGFSKTDGMNHSEVYPGKDQIIGNKPDFRGVAKNGKNYDINFNEAPLSEFVKVVLRDTLAISYVFDPRVRGSVTVATGGPISKDDLLSILEVVLSLNGAALIAQDRGYWIVPSTQGQRNLGLNFDYHAERKSTGPGYGISVVSLKYVSSDTILRMLKSFFPQPHTVNANVYKNLLILRGTGKVRRSLLEFATMFDVDWMKGQSAGIYTLTNSSPAEIIPELRQIFRTKEQGKGLVRFRSIERLNAVLVLTSKSKLLERVGTWVTRLDRDGMEGDDYYVYRVENGKAKDLAEILMATFGGTQLARGAEESQVAPDKAAIRLTSGKTDEATLNEQSSGGNDNKAPQRQSPLSTVSKLTASSSSSQPSGPIRIIPDEINNKLLIKAPARIYRKILRVLRRIDRPPLQVLINATLAEVTLNDNLRYGVQFYLQRNKGKSGLLGFTNGTGPGIEISPVAPGLNFIVGSTVSPKVILDALASETAVRVVSSPSVVVLHNQSATLQVGDEVPIATRQVSNTITNPDAPLVNEIEFKNTGVILKVTPRINSNGLVTMDIKQEISAVTKSTSVGDTGTLTPTISQRRIASTIAVQSGQMVVLGGLISEQIDQEKKRVPILRKIPYLGDVVGSTGDLKTRTELVVFLRPTIIREPRDAARVAEAIRAQMQSLAPRPAPWDDNDAWKVTTTSSKTLK